MKNINNQFIVPAAHKIILRHSKGWQKYKSARLQVSVLPNPIFDPRFRSILNWTVDNFDSVTLCLHDTIQRYNAMSAGASLEEAYSRALSDGDLWLKENIYPSDIFVDVIRWDQLLAHPRYQESYKRVCDLYGENKAFSEAVDADTNNFAQRCRKRGEEFGIERMALSKAFLLEEISGYIPLFQDSSAADIHPGMRMTAMKLLLNGVGNFDLKDNLCITVKTLDVEQIVPQVREEMKASLCAA